MRFAYLHSLQNSCLKRAVPYLPVLSRKGVGWTEVLTLIQAFNTAQFPSGIDALRGAPYLVHILRKDPVSEHQQCFSSLSGKGEAHA